MRILAAGLGLGHLSGTVLLTGLSFISSAFGFAGTGCYGRCGDGEPWYNDVDSWQWDAIGFLGAAAGLAGLVALVFALGQRRWWPALVPLSAQAALFAPVVALLVQADEYNLPQLTVGYLVTVAAGFGLVYVQHRRRARTR